MSTEVLDVSESIPKNAIVVKGADLEVSAKTPDEMLRCQASLITWCAGKINLVAQEAKELKEAYDHAVKHKWKSGTLKRHSDLAMKRLDFYERMKKALEAGYYIVPNFPVGLFAIRTEKRKPLRLFSTYPYQTRMQDAQSLPEGKGTYQNPHPLIRHGYERTVKDSQGRESKVTDWWADDWDSFEFPINMAKPHIMEAATNAMALKIFDDLGVLPDPNAKKADPVIVGRLIDPRSNTTYTSSRRYVTFMLAWHLDTSTL